MSFFKAVWEFLSRTIEIGTFELPFSWLTLAGAVLTLIVMYLVYRLILAGERRLLNAVPAKEHTQHLVLRWSRIGLRILYIVGVFGVIGWLFGARMFEYLGLSVIGIDLSALTVLFGVLGIGVGFELLFRGYHHPGTPDKGRRSDSRTTARCHRRPYQAAFDDHHTELTARE